MCMLAYLNTLVYMRTFSILVFMNTCIHAYIHSCIHAYLHTCTLAYLHTGITDSIGDQQEIILQSLAISNFLFNDSLTLTSYRGAFAPKKLFLGHSHPHPHFGFKTHFLIWSCWVHLLPLPPMLDILHTPTRH